MLNGNYQETVCYITSQKWIFTIHVLFNIYILVYHTLFVTSITFITNLLVDYSEMCHIYKTWPVPFLWCWFLNQLFQLMLVLIQFFFLPSNSCIFFDNAFLYTSHRFPVSSNIFNSNSTQAPSKTPIVSSNSLQ